MIPNKWPDPFRQALHVHRSRYESDSEYRAACDRRLSEDEREWEEHCARTIVELQDTKTRESMAAAERQRIEFSGIPARELEFLNRHDTTPALTVCREFTASDKTVLILGGARGVGKTIAACVSAWEQPGSIRFAKALELVQHGAFDLPFWDSLRSVDSLILDDLGTEPLDTAGWGLACILGLIDYRYDQRRRTWITLNLPIDRFFARYGTDGGRLRDKLRECGRYVELKGTSLRAREPAP